MRLFIASSILIFFPNLVKQHNLNLFKQTRYVNKYRKPEAKEFILI
jgi:hypothetical protein